MVKALGLFSGGLDSILAVCLVREQGIKVTAISFETPFFSARNAKNAAHRLGIPLIVTDITEVHLTMLKNPLHGFGANMNPCIDCHVLMVNIAGEIKRSEGYDFVFTGEVLNERPMSQNRRALRIVERDSGCEGFLLRPLSAKLLDPTVPEKEGKVDRDRLLALRGRSRKPQLALARHYGLKDFPTPAGGCLLTDPGFSRRLKELREHEGLDDVRLINLLKMGRHYRLDSGRKIIVGRNHGENMKMEELARAGDTILTPVDIPGPVVMIPNGCSERDIHYASLLCARYSDATPGEDVTLSVRSRETTSTLKIACPPKEGIPLQTI